MLTSLFFHTAFVPVPVTEETVMYHCANEIKDPTRNIYNKRKWVKIEGYLKQIPLYENRYEYIKREKRKIRKMKKQNKAPDLGWRKLIK